MTRQLAAALLLATLNHAGPPAATPVAPSSAAPPAGCPPIHRRLTSAAQRPISVEAAVGVIRLEASDASAIDIVIERHAPSAAECDRLITTIAADDAVEIRTEQADKGRSAALSATVRVTAPANRTARLALFEGRVEIRGWSSGVSAVVERGDITATGVGGRLRLETTIGDIHASVPGGSSIGPTRLRTFNGDVTLRFAETPPNLRLLALSLGGRITSDLPLTFKSGFGPRFAEGTRGSGEPVVSIDVVDGAVAIEVGK